MAQSTKKQSILEKFSAGWLVEILMALARYRGYTSMQKWNMNIDSK